jgi:hypothetical protein
MVYLSIGICSLLAFSPQSAAGAIRPDFKTPKLTAPST